MAYTLARLSTLVSFALAAQPSSPIQVADSTWLGAYQLSSNDKYVVRDGGAQGSIAGLDVQVYGDTGTCTNLSALQSENGLGCGYGATGKFFANTIAINTDDPTVVKDPTEPTPRTFCSPLNKTERLHLTNVVSTGGNTGAVWYNSLYTSPDKTDPCHGNGCPVAGGVAKVEYNKPNFTCTPQTGYWIPSKEPSFGSLGVIESSTDDFIYLMGALNGYLFLSRVDKTGTLDYAKYQYWNGSSWSSDRLTNSTTHLTQASIIGFKVHSLGSWTYNKFYKNYIILDTAPGDSVLAYSSPVITGPYSEAVTLYKNETFMGNEFMYSAQALSSYDPSGETLTFVASRYTRNSIAAVVKLQFK